MIDDPMTPNDKNEDDCMNNRIKKAFIDTLVMFAVFLVVMGIVSFIIYICANLGVLSLFVLFCCVFGYNLWVSGKE